MDERIGSKNNKWKLASDYCPRVLLSKHIKYEKLPGLSLPRRLKSIRNSLDLDCFQRNVLGNSHLSNTQVLLALLLQKNPYLDIGGDVYVITRAAVDYDAKIEHLFGEDGLERVDVEYPVSDELDDTYFDSAEVNNLLVEFNDKLRMRLEPKDLRQDLIILHKFGYFTVSEMTFENSEQSNEISSDLKRKPRPTLLHIRISPWMLDKAIWKNWKNRYSEKKRTAKFKYALLTLFDDDSSLPEEFGLL